MDVFFINFLNGLVAVFTPAVFPLLIIISSVFEKLASTTKQYIINTLSFVLLTIVIYVLGVSQVIKMHHVFAFSDKTLNIIYLFKCLQLIFLVWYISTFSKKYQLLNRANWKQFFRFFGLFIYSFQLAFAAFSSSGPILGSILFLEPANENTPNVTEILLGFSIGLIIPFLFVLWYFSTNYNKLKHKKWWSITQLIIAIILLLDSLIQLVVGTILQG